MTNCGHGCLTTDEGNVCVCPEGSILQDDGQACTGCSSTDIGGLRPALYSCQPQCVAVWLSARLPAPPGRQAVHCKRINRKTIERVDLNGGSRGVVISEDLNSPEGLAIDWVHRRMYWTDKSRSTVDCSSLVGLSRETIVSKGLEKPRGIAVHPLEKKLFWTDIGAQPVVESASLEGKERTIIASTNLVSPSGLAIDFTEDRLFWCDQHRGLVETAALDGSDRRILLENQVALRTEPFLQEFGILHKDTCSLEELAIDLTISDDPLFLLSHSRPLRTLETELKHSDRLCELPSMLNSGRPFDLAVFEDRLWISDRERRQLTSVHKRTGKKLQSIHGNMVQPSAIVVVHPLAKPGADVCLHLNGGCAQVCESKLGLAHCSCLSRYILSADGRSCSSADASNGTAESGESDPTDVTSLKRSEPTLFTDKMVSDQNECDSLRCDVNAQCLLRARSPTCLCLEGFTGDGQVCEEPEAASTWVTTGSPADVTTLHHISNSVESCPPSHESYCLYQGVCFYFPELKSYACNCPLGYMGERCQFSDLEWWELQQAEEEKRRNVVIAASMVLLISLLSIAACITYCYGEIKEPEKFFRKQPSVDNVSETSVTDESTSESSPVPRFYLLMENGAEGRVVPAMGCPRRAICPSCSSDTGDSPVSEESETLSKHNRGYECSMVSAAAMEITQPTGPSPASSYSCSSLVSKTTSLESPAS
ncbi:unnamed protein product [Pleuronectes platessa]|uniref:EGF-like domain-containing protein n=1 Tax=Pleuronectes platessa TaxID=8262 RepID=A0A9N7W5G1_PLEPL|nr:unnamed protein product [Pleuronectes platessa]